jgi:hypothetical protein
MYIYYLVNDKGWCLRAGGVIQVESACLASTGLDFKPKYHQKAVSKDQKKIKQSCVKTLQN